MCGGSKVPPKTPSFSPSCHSSSTSPTRDDGRRPGAGAPHRPLQAHAPQPLLQLVQGLVAALAQLERRLLACSPRTT